MENKTVFDKNIDAKKTTFVSDPGTDSIDPKSIFDDRFVRKDLPLPDLGELDVVRHFFNLAKSNFSVDTNFYPLGSCTMKYNPKINEEMAGLWGFSQIHPYQDRLEVQGALELLWDLERILCEVTGMDRFTFQPSSGAQGELTGMLIIRKFHEVQGNKKTKVIVPDSAHGTNPATVAMCGYKTVVVESNKDGLIDMDKLKELVDDEVAAIMLTNPNTLGLFEENILEISEMIHKAGGLLYYDGANFNPLLGITKPSLMGFDVIHLNLHKTFSTPHGCGGPGSGAVGVTEALKDYLPTPIVSRSDNEFYFDYNIKHSIGRLRSFYGNFSVLIRAYTYLLRLGAEGLERVAHNSIINANYIKEKLKDTYEVPFPKTCMHEVVFSCTKQKEKGVSALDIAKRLIDYGVHPPTMYFPLIVKEALMVEPTETESKATCDNFIEIMKKINKEIEKDLDKVKNAPHTTKVKRVDEVKAARSPCLRWQKSGD